MGDLLLPLDELFQTYATQVVCEQDSVNMGMGEHGALTYGNRVSTGTLTETDNRSPPHLAVNRHVPVGNS